MEKFDIKEHPHSRLNILTGERILVSPHRTKRPWQGKTENFPLDDRSFYNPACYLCPGNKRADGSSNPEYKDAFVFTNDYAALVPGTPEGRVNIDNLLEAKSETGICRVISFSPDHSLTLPMLDRDAILKIIDLWCAEYLSLMNNPAIRYIQVFENKGEIMGCSNPHPHGQIWASGSIPVEIEKELYQQKLYFESKGVSLLADYLALEEQLGERIIISNGYFTALVPFWAVWPYETMIVSRRHVQHLLQFTAEEKKGLADILKRLTTRYDNLFNISFPYSAGMHQAPVNDGEHPEWHWHMHFYPPLLRSATVRKFMVGYEMLANPQRDITAESAAKQLRELSEVHYSLSLQDGSF
ncbi:MAG: UDP-glucose--hexose-1-phosphate uridylyltransferase [Sediminibacterium sp.]